jgi:hypothetical protein
MAVLRYNQSNLIEREEFPIIIFRDLWIAALVVEFEKHVQTPVLI